MKLVVISDTHGRKHRVREVLERHRDYEAVLFLGDGLGDIESESLCGLAAVRGNCDAFSALWNGGVANERMLCFGSFKVLMMHGHLYGVKSGIDRAVAYAASRDADILLYGHTHIRQEKYYPQGSEVGGIVLKKPMWVFNPGSLGQPTDGVPSYGIIEIRNGSVLFSHGSV
jgi:putative phosphoesterase